MRTLLLAIWLLMMPNTAITADPVVFVSAFKTGDEGAIHAYRFDSATGKLQLLRRTIVPSRLQDDDAMPLHNILLN